MRWYIWLGLGILALAIAVMSPYFVWKGISTNRLNEELAAIRAKGEPLTMADFFVEKVPDSQNSALVYQKVAMIIKDPAFANDISTIESFAAKQGQPLDETSLAACQRSLDNIRHIFPMLEEAASLPKYRVKRNWEAGPGVLFPDYPQLRKMARILKAGAIVEAHDSDMEGAVRHVETCFKVGESLDEQPVYISFNVRCAINSIAVRSLTDIAQYGEISEEQAKHLNDILAKMDVNPSYVRTLQGERIFAVNNWQSIYNQFADDYIDFPMSHRLTYRCSFAADEAVFLERMRIHIKQSQYTYREITAKRLKIDTDFPKYAILSPLITPTFTKGLAKRDYTTSQIAGSQVFLAILAYKDRFGSYPQTLDEVRQKLGWKLDKDIFSGKDFIYKRQGSGFLLYSIGENLKDDGGRDPRQPGGNRSDSDIVWRVDR